MATINYDKSVSDFIAALSATGHVTHTKYKKTSVTFHHNGGNLTHAGCLSVWKVRPASAHFDVDDQGRVAQYVHVKEYAWAVGNRGGNESTISIEMANKTLAPKWEVSTVTWKEAARLAGWLFAHEIKDTPTKNNVHYHHDWSATACPGPYMDSVRSKVLAEVQKWYAYFTENPSSPRPSTPEPPKKSYVDVAREVIAGNYGNEPERSKKLKAEGYDPKAVQSEVNRILKAGTGTTKKPVPKKSVNELAKEVIAGKWGDGDERRKKLTAKGYNYSAVQKEVNRLVG